MVIAALTEEQKQKLQAAIKERYAKKGFDHEEMWAWHERIHNGTPVTLREFLMKILGEAKRRGWLDEARLDYEPQPVEKKGDIPLAPDYDWQITAWPNFGGSEGVYLDWKYEGRYRDGKTRIPAKACGLTCDRICRDDPGRGYIVTYRLHCGKTLDEDLGGMERMSLLCGRILWLVREIPV